jgi:formylglycine-generating enzyme required for sulfatase activity
LFLLCSSLACKSVTSTPAQEALDSLRDESSYVKVKPGEFLMGSPDEGKGAASSERPQHPVRISREHEMGKYEVTQRQWEAVMGSNPSAFKGIGLPVTNVSWNDAQEFIKRLQTHDGKFTYRLPTEAEWEYACRAGSTGAFAGEDWKETLERRRRKKETGKGKTETQSLEWTKHLEPMAWFDANSLERPHPVGRLAPNAWGLHDMHGNVWEWVEDWYDPNYYKNSPAEDPPGPAAGQSKVHRGGSWQSPVWNCRAAFRGFALPAERNTLTGFRLVRVRK